MSRTHNQNFTSVLYCFKCCDRKARAASVQSFTLWQQATIEITCHDHSAYTSQYVQSFTCLYRQSLHAAITLLLLVRTTYIWVLFFAHIPYVVNRTSNATPAERLQQQPLLFTTNRTNHKFFL